MSTTSLAVDIGAESGRILAGTLKRGHLGIHEVCRFPNTPIRIDGTLRWNIQELIANVFRGLETFGGKFDSVGVDTWGVDYVLVGEDNGLVEPPFHYRDERTNGAMAHVAEKFALDRIYGITGIQFLPFNTIFQLASTPKSTFLRAKHFLTIPDYIHFQLSQDKAVGCEYTNATTTQLLDARTRDWSEEILDSLEIPRSIFPKIIEPGTRIGKIEGGSAELIVPACHDTGSAVVAIPSASTDVAWISSGTWSILGVESPHPIVSDESYRLNYTNEGGVLGTVRFCKNVMGLWILQECRRTWGDVSYADLMAEAECAPSVGAWINPDDARFLPPGDMPQRILDLLAETNQKAPSSRGEMVRLILESLALKYRVLIDQLEGLVGHRISAIHIFGGGSQNSLLNQFTANACARPVVAGPVEATAIGNLLMQSIALGNLGSLKEARQVVAASFACQTFTPRETQTWSDSLQKFSRNL